MSFDRLPQLIIYTSSTKIDLILRHKQRRGDEVVHKEPGIPGHTIDDVFCYLVGSRELGGVLRG